MKNYFKRLKNHPGLGVATFFTFIGFFAGAKNTSFEVWWHGGLFGMCAMGCVVWTCVLISNFEEY